MNGPNALPPDRQAWMHTPQTRQLMAALTSDGGEARFIGGCVRDAVLERPVQDVDIATTVVPQDVLVRLKRHGIRAIPTGLEHGTITAVVDHVPFEITTLRKDISTDGRRAVVAFTHDWYVDASRRDFTMNALSCDMDGTVYDPFGGISDAKAGRVRFIGDPEKRLAEDVLRLLRFFRFHAHYGQGTPDEEGLNACARMSPRLTTLSGERVCREILKLLGAPDPSPVWSILLDFRIVSILLPEAADLRSLQYLVTYEKNVGLNDPLRRLAVLLSAGDAMPVAHKLKLSVKERQRLQRMTESTVDVTLMDTRPLRRHLRKDGRETVLDIFLIHAAKQNTPHDQVTAVHHAIQHMAIPLFPLTGKDLLDRGLSPGPAIGQWLSRLEQWWEDSDCTPDRNACLVKLDAQLGLTSKPLR